MGDARDDRGEQYVHLLIGGTVTPAQIRMLARAISSESPLNLKHAYAIVRAAVEKPQMLGLRDFATREHPFAAAKEVCRKIGLTTTSDPTGVVPPLTLAGTCTHGEPLRLELGIAIHRKTMETTTISIGRREDNITLEEMQQHIAALETTLLPGAEVGIVFIADVASKAEAERYWLEYVTDGGQSVAVHYPSTKDASQIPGGDPSKNMLVLLCKKCLKPLAAWQGPGAEDPLDAWKEYRDNYSDLTWGEYMREHLAAR